jgi:hypothetical protein
MRARRDGFLSDSFLTVLFWDGTDDSSLPQLPEAPDVGCNAIVREDSSHEARSAPQQAAPETLRTGTSAALVYRCPHRHSNKSADHGLKTFDATAVPLPGAKIEDHD